MDHDRITDETRPKLMNHDRKLMEHDRRGRTTGCRPTSSTSARTPGGRQDGLVVMDVFTREAAVEPLQNKNAETVAGPQARRAGADGGRQELCHNRPGNEFAALDRELPAEAVRRTKRPEDRNAIAVVDRGIQTLKKDLATRWRARAGSGATTLRGRPAHNARPRDGARRARGVEKQPATEFRVLQDNADKFQHNKDLTAARSFNPQYGNVQQLRAVDSMTVRSTRAGRPC